MSHTNQDQGNLFHYNEHDELLGNLPCSHPPLAVLGEQVDIDPPRQEMRDPLTERVPSDIIRNPLVDEEFFEPIENWFRTGIDEVEFDWEDSADHLSALACDTCTPTPVEKSAPPAETEQNKPRLEQVHDFHHDFPPTVVGSSNARESVLMEDVAPPPPSLNRHVTPPDISKRLLEIESRLLSRRRSSVHETYGATSRPSFSLTQSQPEAIPSAIPASPTILPTCPPCPPSPPPPPPPPALISPPPPVTPSVTTTSPQQVGNTIKRITRVRKTPTAPKKPTTSKALTRKKRTRRKPNQKAKQYVEKTKVDVLMGRGGGSNHHDGNVDYRKHIVANQKRYQKLPREEKTKFSEDVVKWVKKRGGRFIKREGGKGSRWYVIDDTTARQKVSQALREDHTEQGRKEKRERLAKFKTTKGDA